MTMVVVKDFGLKNALDGIVIGSFGGGTWRVGLYTDDITPDKDSVYDDFTESTVTGLTPQDLDYTNWSAAVIDTAQGLIEYDPPLLYQPTTMSGLPEDIYGWIFYKVGSPNKLWAAERFAELLHFTTTDDSLTLYPKIRSDDL